MLKNVLFPGKIYTAGKNFTQPPVMAGANNFNSVPTWFKIQLKFCFGILKISVEIGQTSRVLGNGKWHIFLLVCI